MEQKHFAQVLIDGKIYTVGAEEEGYYLQKVAGYINEKTAALRRQKGFNKQNQDYQSMMIQLNIADDYFKALDEIEALRKKCDEMETEMYSLKHELISLQMKDDGAQGKVGRA
ncbi:MAG: cell division protein ZapA [Lachnospiraceae bacterium]|jgi:cell division protein ZapA|nr:cell division protein ZapA [Lachnospiraceae bacterium]